MLWFVGVWNGVVVVYGSKWRLYGKLVVGVSVVVCLGYCGDDEMGGLW